MQQVHPSIVQRCCQGDKEAFSCVVEQYQRMVFSLTLKLLCDEDEAMDAAQETFIRIWLNINDYQEQRTRFSTWIHSIATHICLDRLKQKRRQVPMPEDERVLTTYLANKNPTHQLENKEWISIVKTLAEGLSEKQRLVFTLSHLEGLDSAEIEQVTGLDAKQIKSNLYVARQHIRERLKRLGYESNE